MSYLNWSLALKTKSCSYWHEWSAFQSIAVQAIEWHADSGPLFSTTFS